MKPHQKAKDIVDKFYIFNHLGNKHAIKCASIAVEEIMNALEENGSWNYDYWNEVKQEIEKL